ncbi:MAG: FGGY family carbohydrate kinase [Cellulomonas sp.]|nr:FGGY family carbohydrate kinase [Cellulomonas sp.]MCR6648772.1 FGGY family carbohydrate kinase [Cellulomonas sp.]
MLGVTTALGIDVGTTHTKVALVDVDAPRTLSVASAPTSGPADLLRVVADLTRRVLAAAPDAPVPAAVGVASMAETGVPIGPDDEPRGDWLRWDGHRAGAQADALAARLGRAELFAATGVRASAKVPLATWAWLRDEQSGRRARSRAAAGAGERGGAVGSLHGDGRWAGAADLVVLGLTGRLVTDHTLAGRTMAYRLGDVRTGLPAAFDADLLAEVGLAPHQVPRVLRPGETVPLRAGALTDAGLLAGTPVTVAGHDHAVGAFAAGVRAAGDVADSVGTSEVVCTVLAADPERVPVAAAGMSLVRTVRGDAPALVAGSSSAGGAVAAWLAHVAPADERAALLARASAVDDALVALLVGDVARMPDVAGVPAATDAMVGAVADGRDPFVVLPYVHGRQTPAPDAAATLRAVGLVPTDPVAALRGVLLGAALQARWMLDAQAALAGAPPARVRALGRPMIANPAWAALKRWCSPVPLDVVADEEAVAAGAALLAAERAALATPAPVLRLLPEGPPASRIARAAVGDRLGAFIGAATSSR